MINNEMEKNASLDSVSDLEFGKNRVEMMRYRANSLSYMLGFGGIICSLLAAFICLNSTQPNTVVVILKIMLNIIILLGGFLCCENTKAYSKRASIAMIVFGGICVARIFWIPLQLIIYYNKYVAAFNAGDLEGQAAAAKYVGLPITGHFSGGANAWLPYSGNFRGVAAIVLLSVAATFFIASGVVGYIRSTRLNNYLDSLKEKN